MNKQICCIENCENPKYTDVCRKHYDQKIHNRGIFKNAPKYQKRIFCEFTIKGDICIISLYNKFGFKKADSFIDVEDYEKCKLYKWHGMTDRDGNIRVYSKQIGSITSVILGFASSSLIVADHIDGNTLNNRKNNLQICSNQQNVIKQKFHKNNTSGYKGVVKGRGGWQSQITHNQNTCFIGYYKTKEKAAIAYNEKAKELFGKFAVLNEVTLCS